MFHVLPLRWEAEACTRGVVALGVGVHVGQDFLRPVLIEWEHAVGTVYLFSLL